MGKKTEEENQALAAARAAASKQLSSASFQSTSFVSAVIVALLPCYVFSQIYDVSIASYWIMYALLTPAAAFALLTSYNLTFNSTGARLLVQFKASPHTYKKVGCESAKEFDAMVEENLVGETSAWTFLFCNLCFSLTFAFLAFYVLRNVELPYSYCVSTAAAGALTYYLAFVTKVK